MVSYRRSRRSDFISAVIRFLGATARSVLPAGRIDHPAEFRLHWTQGEGTMRRSWVCISLSLAMGLFSSAAGGERPTRQSAQAFPSRILAAHNAVRLGAGVAPLRWDNQLGTQAAKYAVELAMTGRFAHASASARNGTAENLWMGTRGAFTVEAMVGGWVSEKRLFRAGVFPHVSRNGNWHDIGHYTQMIWPSTQRVGCALATSASAEYLVCRYWPAGNVIGTPMFVR